MDINLSKINLFLGPNNSGKSAILSSLSLLSQTMKSPDFDLPLSFSGPYKEFGTFYDVVFNNDLRRNIEIGFSLEAPPISKGGADELFANFSFKYRPRLRDLLVSNIEYKQDRRFLLKAKRARKSKRLLFESTYLEGSKGKPLYLDKYFALNHFLPFPTVDLMRKISSKDLFALHGPSRQIRSVLESIEYLGPFRMEPTRFHRYSGEKPSSVGPHGEYAQDLLLRYYLYDRKKRKELFIQLKRYLEKMGIASPLYIEEISDMVFEILAKHPITQEIVNLADIGYGCSQVLPILLAGFTMKPHSILMIEQPELHLHPKAQAELGNFILDISELRDQIIIETHSEHLLLRLQTLVASGHIDENDIKVHYVYSAKDGKKKVKELNMDEKGLFIEDWPEGFFPERYEEARKLAKAARRK